MKELFLRAFSSIYVHYIPLQGFGSLGTSLEFSNQITRLSKRIQSDTQRVKASKRKAWIAFDSYQMSTVMDLTFEHLTSGKSEPFDFEKCFQRIEVPNSTEESILQYLNFVKSLSPQKVAIWDIDTEALLSEIISTALLLNGTAGKKKGMPDSLGIYDPS